MPVAATLSVNSIVLTSSEEDKCDQLLVSPGGVGSCLTKQVIFFLLPLYSLH